MAGLVMLMYKGFWCIWLQVNVVYRCKDVVKTHEYMKRVLCQRIYLDWHKVIVVSLHGEG